MIIGNGVYGYVQPDGTWGWSNAGLIVSEWRDLAGRHADERAADPRDARYRDAKVPEAAKIDRLVNTHANPDHFFGNGLVADAEIIGTRRGEGRWRASIQTLRGLKDNYLQAWATAGAFLYETMGRKFDFSGVDEDAAQSDLRGAARFGRRRSASS